MGGISNGSSTSTADGQQHNFAPGDIVLGKIKGYPPWPGVLCHEDNVPKKNVLSARPGKNYYIVRFFPAADYGFNRSHELRRLTKREIEAFLSDPHKRTADLREAYKLALDPESWNEEQNGAVRQAEEEDEEEEDMLADEDGQEIDEDEQPVKKRKSSSAGKQDSAASTSASAVKKQKKNSLTSAKPEKKAQSISDASRQRELSGSPQKHSHAGDGETEEAELDPETKKVKSWRYALQHAFLPRSGVIQGDEAQKYDVMLKQVEQYQGITASQLRQTKIGKVMKRIVQLKDVPHDDEYHFRRRAQKLCDVWGELIAGTVGPPSAKAEPSSGGDTNGATADSAVKSEASVEKDTEQDRVVETENKAENKAENKPEASVASSVIQAGDESILTQGPDAN